MKTIQNVILTLLGAGVLFGLTNCSTIKKAVIPTQEKFYCMKEDSSSYSLVPIYRNNIKHKVRKKSTPDLYLRFLSKSKDRAQITDFYNQNDKPGFIVIEYSMDKDGNKKIHSLKKYNKK